MAGTMINWTACSDWKEKDKRKGGVFMRYEIKGGNG